MSPGEHLSRPWLTMTINPCIFDDLLDGGRSRGVPEQNCGRRRVIPRTLEVITILVIQYSAIGLEFQVLVDIQSQDIGMAVSRFAFSCYQSVGEALD